MFDAIYTYNYEMNEQNKHIFIDQILKDFGIKESSKTRIIVLQAIKFENLSTNHNIKDIDETEYDDAFNDC